MQTDSIKKIGRFFFRQTTSRFIKAGLLICLVFFSPVFAHLDTGRAEIKRALIEFDNGNYPKVIELINTGVEKAKKIKDSLLISEGLDIKASSEISLQKYDEAAKTLEAALEAISENQAASYQKALIYIHYAWLYRSQRKFSESFNYSKKAVAAAPADHHILAANYLNTGRSLFASGYDIAAIVWLEKAEKLLETERVSSDKIETYRFLSLAWWSKLNYQTALKYSEQCVSLAENSRFKYKHRRALFDLQTILSESGQEKRAVEILEIGLKLSEAESDSYQASIFLSSLLLHALDVGDKTRAFEFLNRLEEVDEKKQFTFEINLGRAIIAAFQNQPEVSERIFAEIEKQEKPSDYPPLYWKLIIAERKRDWEQFIKINQELLDLTTKDNFRSGLPKIHLNFARAYFHLNQPRTSSEYLQKSLEYIEEIRKSENYNLSLSLSENYHDAYRLLAQIKSENVQESFELVDFLKARLLKDRIDNAAIKHQSVISPTTRKTLEELSLKYIEDHRLVADIEKNERFITDAIPDLDLAKPNLLALDRIPELNNTAVISYFFTLDKRLLAFVWEKNKPLKSIYLPVSEDEIESDAKNIHLKIKNFIFFKRDGKEIFDKLLKPLSLSAKHYVIVPDKHLWKIPFQALSPDGEKYLIEDKVISYAPSVAILLELLRAPRPVRHTLQAFANSSYNNQFLQYVNAEATSVAGLFNSSPVLNASIADFRRFSDKADMLHFSMHAQVDNYQPLDSFLGFRRVGKDDGRLTVEDFLNTRLRKGSLVFLASCDTNNVLSGEGLVSLAWGMMGSGATTVVSAQWEANDKLTRTFATAFYRSYKQGFSAAEALQKASMEMITNKSTDMHEPYYWADFTLNGDFR